MSKIKYYTDSMVLAVVFNEYEAVKTLIEIWKCKKDISTVQRKGGVTRNWNSLFVGRRMFVSGNMPGRRNNPVTRFVQKCNWWRRNRKYFSLGCKRKDVWTFELLIHYDKILQKFFHTLIIYLKWLKNID